MWDAVRVVISCSSYNKGAHVHGRGGGGHSESPNKEQGRTGMALANRLAGEKESFTSCRHGCLALSRRKTTSQGAMTSELRLTRSVSSEGNFPRANGKTKKSSEPNTNIRH